MVNPNSTDVDKTTSKTTKGLLNSAYVASNPDIYTITHQVSTSTTFPNIESSRNLISPNSTAQAPTSLPNSIFVDKSSRSKEDVIETKKSCFNRPKTLIPLIILSVVISVGAITGVVYAIVTSKSSNSINNDNGNSELSLTAINTQYPLTTQTTLYFSTKSQTNDKINNISVLKTCGVSKYPPNLQLTRIMRGYNALPHSWPWTVSIGYEGPRTSLPHACGGSLVNKRFIITATHCVQKSSIFSLVGDPIKNSDKYGSVEKMMRIYVGITVRSSDINADNTYGAEEIIIHPDFDTNTFKNDLAIIKLNRDVPESDEINFVCLSKNTNTEPATEVYAVGWGFTEGNFYRASDNLNQVRFQIQTQNTCGLVYLPVLQFCAGNPALGKDTCNGDSGGPVMQLDSEKRWTLVGVVSNGDAMCTGRGIYTNVSFFLDWIKQNTKLTMFR